MRTDPGCVRKRNEDSLALVDLQGTGWPGRAVLAVVADGMGGHQAGDRASRLAVETISQAFGQGNSRPDQSLSAAFHKANARIQAEAASDQSLAGMGTTAVALAILDGLAWFAHVGDSRLYFLRGDSLEQLSEDHTLVNALLRDGLITPDQAHDHPDRHVLVRAMGTQPSVEVMAPATPIRLDLGDTFLLCSDGLHDLVEPGEIRRILAANTPRQACARLVDLARERGGHDNISVVVVRCAAEVETETGLLPSTRDIVEPSHD